MAKPMLAYNPVMQFFNTDGTVLNGGKIYIYQPGTTTLLNTYPTAADAAAGTNANPNPMICDSSGRPSSGGNPYECYVTQSYKMVVKTSADVTVRTVDNVVTLGQLVATSAKSTNYTVTTSDRDKIIVVDSSGGNKTITLPAAATAGDGFIVRVKKMDTSSNLVLIQGNAAENIDGANYTALTQSYEYVTLTCDGTQWIKDRPKGQLFWVEVTCGQAALASGGSVTIQASAGSQQFKVRNIILSGSGTNFSGGGGNRLLSVTDNTSTWTVVPAATLQSLAASKWGDSTPVPFPATVAHINTASAAGTAIVAKYSGGTTDYTAGSCTLLICLERVT
jgi:hypothetical protein